MRGAIFDVDGTVLDSMQVWWDAAREYFDKMGVEFDEETAREVREMSLGESLPMLMERYGLNVSIDEAIAKLRTAAETAYKTSIPLKPGVKEYMEQLKGEGVKIAVATSGYEALCKAAFKRLGIYDYIDAYAFAYEAGDTKKSPAVYLLAAERIGEKPKDCTVYEDIIVGIESAKSAGFLTCAVYDDTNADITDVLKQRADRYITGWSELLKQ
ncbi:MAG: HAD family phosphatase [Clostridiales bacterium]|nr:HAD family phosphatase [Clostridiales bacterium]